LASGKGFEPLFADSKSAVLPLDEPERYLRIENKEIGTLLKFLILASAGFEPATSRFEFLRSDPLSYEAVKLGGNGRT
jgi:hypothetical protein